MMAHSPSLRRRAWFASLLTLSSLSLAHAGNPWDSEPTEIPEEDYAVNYSPMRNPLNRIGVQGSTIVGVKAKFISQAFLGEDILGIPNAAGPEDVIVGPGRASDEENGGLGGDLFYERVLGESDLADEGVNETWGLHIGLGFNQLGFRANSKVESFRQLPADAPADANADFLADGNLRHGLDADMWRLDIGLFKESNLSDRIYAKFGGGLTVAYIDADFTNTGPFGFAPEYADEQDFVFGGYLDLTVGYDITRNWSLYAGVRYQYLGDFEVSNPYASAKLEFDQSYMAFLGVRFAF